MKISILMTAVATLSACGIKGPPLPPLREETIQTQKAQAVQAAPTAISQDNTKAKQKKKK